MILFVGEPALTYSARFVRQLLSWIGLVIVMALSGTLSFAQTVIDPTGRSGQPPCPLKEEFQRPQPPPSPVLPIVPLPRNGEGRRRKGGMRVFDHNIHEDGSTDFSDAEINKVT